MDNLLKDMGKRIFDRRKQLNMTQETLAELAHVTPQTISTAELGQKAMRPETILKVCDALNISTEYLLRGINHHRNRFLPSYGEDFHTNAQTIQAF